VATSETKCAFQQFTQAESSVLAPFKVSSSMPKSPPPSPHSHWDRQGTLTGFCWFYHRSCYSFGKHQAWQFRKAQGWEGRACTCQKRNEESLSFSSDPVITTWYRFQGKAAVMCIVSIHRVHAAYMGISVQSLWGNEPRFPPNTRRGAHR